VILSTTLATVTALNPNHSWCAHLTQAQEVFITRGRGRRPSLVGDTLWALMPRRTFAEGASCRLEEGNQLLR
jgi:hypothetical protein